MSSDKIKNLTLNEIEKIQNSLREKNDAQRGAINLQLISIIDMLKKHIIDKQKKLDDFAKKLNELTNDEIGKGLLEAFNYQLRNTGEDYASILKFEAETKTPDDDAENLKVLLEISSKLGELVSKLQSIEDTFNDTVERA